MIDKKAPCNEPFAYMVSITVQSQNSYDTICDLVREDLATTLATTSDLITCQKDQSSLDQPEKGIKTVLARIKRYRSIGMHGNHH